MSPPNPLRQLHRLKVSSPQFPAEITTILNGEEYKAAVVTLQDKDLVWLVNYLDTACSLRCFDPIRTQLRCRLLVHLILPVLRSGRA